MNVKHIIEGIKNSIFVKEEVEKIASQRYAICRGCPANSSNQNKPDIIKPEPGPYYLPLRPDEHCTHCACNLHAKIRSLHTACPIDKWPAVATKEEAAKIAVITDES